MNGLFSKEQLQFLHEQFEKQLQFLYRRDEERFEKLLQAIAEKVHEIIAPLWDAIKTIDSENKNLKAEIKQLRIKLDELKRM